MKNIIAFLILIIICAGTINSCEDAQMVGEVKEQIETVTPLKSVSVTKDLIPTMTTMPSRTPIPKITIPPFSAEIEDNYFNILKTNGNCELPCFWGMNPGKTTWEDAQALLSSVGADKKSFEPSDMLTNKGVNMYGITWNGYPKEDYFNLDLIVGVQDNHIAMIIINSRMERGNISSYHRRMARYSLSNIFKKLGLPDQVYVYPPYKNFPNYSIDLIYRKLMLYIGLRGEATKENNEEYRLCPNINDEDSNIYELQMVMALKKSPETGVGPYGYQEGFYNDNGDVINTYPFQKITGISIKEFSDLILSGETTCFTVKSVE